MSSTLTKALAPFDKQVKEEKEPLPKAPCNYGIFARKGMGKTTLLLNLISRPESPWYKHFNMIFLISPTANRDKKMKELVEDIGDQYYEELNYNTLKEIEERIDAFIEDWEKKRKRNKKKGDPAFLIIYDDIIHELKNKKDVKLMNKFATQNRHRFITNIYLLQKYTGFLDTVIRINLDLISYYRTDNYKELESFADERSENKKKLLKLYEFATSEPYSFLHINMYNQPTRYYKRFDEIEYKAKE